MRRVLLSVPHMSGREEGYVQEAFATNWLSPVGPHLEAFEREFSARMDVAAVALSSGTAAIHLGLRLLGAGPGDEVFCPTLTFVATANPILYLGARPVFLDSDRASWNVDPQLVEDALRQRARVGRLPKAVIAVHLYGQSSDMAPLLEACNRYGIPILEDAAEALGGTYRGRPTGTWGAVGAWSFNGNKIITTTGGGMLGTENGAWAVRARYWATQARDPGLSYEHSETGYNYRMSNVLAGIGRGQLEVLDHRVHARRAIAFRYREALADIDGLSLMPQAPYGLHTNWLSCFLVDDRLGVARNDLIARLGAAGIETRPVWKPMHRQALFAGAECFRGEVADDLHRCGICLPSSSNLSLEDQLFVVNEIRRAAGARTISALDHPPGSADSVCEEVLAAADGALTP